MKKCPFCGADIEDSARFCLYCMQSLTEKEPILPPKKNKPQWMIIIAAIVVAIAVMSVVVAIMLSDKPAASDKESSSEDQQSSIPSTDFTVPSDTQSNTEPPHTHSFYVENTDIKYQKAAATCIAPAVYYYSCLCGETGSETFFFGAPGEHHILTDSGYAANCIEAGLTDGAHCSVCNAVLISQTQLPVTNHTYDDDQDEVCNVCDFIRVLNCKHTETVTLSAISPTCTAGGLTEGKKCALCEAILTTQTALAPLGHKAATDQAIAATCTAGGLTEGRHCTTCNTILVPQIAVAAKGHTEVIDPAIAATCTTDGKTEGKHCSLCQIVLVYQQHILTQGHSFDPKNPAAPCSLCGVLPHIHSFTEQNTDAKYLKKAAECTSAARYYYSCICGEKGDDYFYYGRATGHTIVTELGYPASCVTEGLTDRKYCSVCNDCFEFHSPIPSTGHSYALSSSPSPCLTCGKQGGELMIVAEPEVPCILGGTLQINSCTYTVVKQFSSGTWYVIFYINYTNITSETTSYHPFGSAYPAGESFGLGCASSDYKRQLEPNESGNCLIYAQLPSSYALYTLKLNAG